MKTLKKLLSVVLVLAMLCSVMVIPALAVEGEEVPNDEVAPAAEGDVVEFAGETYMSLFSAIEAISPGGSGTLTLIDDIVLENTVEIPAGKTITLDLNGNTIENKAESWVIKVDGNSILTVTDSSANASGTIKGWKGISVVQGSELKFEKGNVVTSGATGAGVQVYGSSATMSGGTITSAYGAILIYSNNETRGTFNMSGGKLVSESPAIYANGSEEWDNCDVTISGGEITGTTSAIYWPSAGKLTIKGGTLTGNTAVYVKSGSLEITGGTLIGNGAKADFVHQPNSGYNLTGDALVIENVASGGYEAVSAVSVTNGTFISANANAIGSYAATASVKAVDNFISGGTFSSDVSDYVVEGYVAKLNADGKYTVVTLEEAYVAQVGEKKYLSLQAAVAEAKDGDTVTLLKNDTASAAIVLDKAIILDGNGNTLTSSATRAINVDCAGKVEIKDLTIATSKNTERAINVIQKAANLTLKNVNAAGFKYTINVAASSVGSTLTINGGVYSGYAALNITGDNTTVNATNVDFASVNIYDTPEANSFSTIAIGDKTTGNTTDNVTISITGGSISAKNTGKAGQVCFGFGVMSDGSSVVTNLSANVNTTWILDGDNVGYVGIDEDITAKFISGGTFSEDVSKYVVDGLACSKVGDNYIVHMHDKDEVVDTATCTTAGEKTFSCSVCGQQQGEPVASAAKGHKWVEALGEDPTCEKDGFVEYYCENDPAHKKTETVPATGHKWDEGKVTTEATCETKGVKTFVCANDETHTKTEEIAAAGHKWNAGEVTTAATCTTAGVKSFVCETDKTHTKTEEIPALGHKFVDGVCANCKLSVIVESESADTVTKEEVKVEEVEEVTVVETTETKEAEASVKTETTTIVTEVVTDVTKAKDLADDGVVTQETAANLVAVAAVVNGDEKMVEEALTAGIITKEEVTAIEKAVAEGKPAVTATIVVNEVSETVVADAAEKAIEDAVEKEIHEDAVVACYLDVSVVLSSAGGKELGTLDKLEEPITITVAVPEELKGDNRVYHVVRNHDGVVEILDTTLNADGTISFTTDCFSTYAIAYSEKAAINTPPTGDTSYIALYAMIMTVALAGAVIVYKKKARV